MLFHSYFFLFGFLPLVWLLFDRLRGAHPDLALATLGSASLLFYAYWNPAHLPLLLLSITVNFGIGLSLAKSRGRHRRTGLAALAIAFNIALLARFKYAGFLNEVGNDLLAASPNLSSLALPLAISFFSFQQIAYIVDAYRHRAAELSFLRYLSFVAYFPQLIAGPIVRHGELMPELLQSCRNSRRLDDLSAGLFILTLGLFKKVVIADALGGDFRTAHLALQQGAVPGMLEAWFVMTIGALYIYFDYSAYIDMALGVSLLFGIRLTMNFYSPFRASSPRDFWRRWNATLMRFLRDYLYIPLGGNRRGMARLAAATLITAAISGLWHGAGYNFVAWGVLVGLILVANAVWVRQFPPPAKPSRIRTIAGRGISFVCFVFPWTLFMIPDFAVAWSVMQAMLDPGRFDFPAELAGHLGSLGAWLQLRGLPFSNYQVFWSEWAALRLSASLLIVYALPNALQLTARFRPCSDIAPIARRWGSESRLRWQPTSGWALFTVALLLWSLFEMQTLHEFYYFQF